MQMHQDENTSSKISSSHCELEPAIIRSKRERSTTELTRHKQIERIKFDTYTSTGNQKIRIYAKCARRISIFCVNLNLVDLFQLFLFNKGSAREDFYNYSLKNSVLAVARYDKPSESTLGN